MAENTMKPTMQMMPQAILIQPVNSPPKTIPKPDAAIAIIAMKNATGPVMDCENFSSASSYSKPCAPVEANAESATITKRQRTNSINAVRLIFILISSVFFNLSLAYTLVPLKRLSMESRVYASFQKTLYLLLICRVVFRRKSLVDFLRRVIVDFWTVRNLIYGYGFCLLILFSFILGGVFRPSE